MRYGEILKRAWRGTWIGGMWGYLITWYLVFIAASVVLAGAFALFVGFQVFDTLGSYWPLGGGEMPEFTTDVLVGLGALGVLALLIFVPLGVAMNGGLVHLSNETAEGRRARLGDGWRAAFRMWPRVFVVDISIGVIGFALWIVGVVAFGIVAVAGSGVMALGEDPSALPAGIIGLCCCGGIFYMAVLLVGLVLQAWEALSARHAVIAGASGGAALGEGFAGLRDNFKRVFLMALALFGIAFAVSIATTAISFPLDRLSYSSSEGVALAASAISFVISLISFFVSSAVTLFQYSAWTHFFRDMVGIGPAEQDYRSVPPLPPLPYSPGTGVSSVPPSMPAPPSPPAAFVPPSISAPPEAPMPSSAPAPEPAPPIVVPEDAPLVAPDEAPLVVPEDAPIVEVPPAPEPPADA